MTITLTVSKQMLAEMHQYYTEQIVKVPEYALFQAKTAHCSITAYLSQKVVFQGSEADFEAEIWQLRMGERPFETMELPKAHGLPEGIAAASAIGSDEVGTGDYFGPLVVCAAYVADKKIEQLVKLGIKDSKALKDAEICRLGAATKEMIPHQVLILPNAQYNEMIMRGVNANGIKAFLHNQALLNLLEKLDDVPEYLIMDEFVNTQKYFAYLEQLPKKPAIVRENLHFVQKGESVHVAVALASILAREAFVKYMDTVSDQLGLELPKGAGKIVDTIGRQIVRQHGEDKLRELCKWHFANTKKILSLIK